MHQMSSILNARSYRVKAGALLYAIFLILVISIISSSFILYNYYNNKIIVQSLKQEQLFKDARSGINYGLTLHEQIPLNSSIVVDLFDDEQHKVVLDKKKWGAFYILSSKTNWRNKSVAKAALIGANINRGEKIALYLADQNKPLSLTGRTQIVGDCYIPKAGVKRAYIEGKSFVGSKLINGTKYNSKKVLPTINKKLVDENLNSFEISDEVNDSLLDYELFVEQDSIINSFKNKTLVLYSPFSINLSNKVIEGNIIIKSDQEITINSSALISNAILYAKGILVKTNVVGNMQLFAQDSILVAKNTKLKYPSVLALINEQTQTGVRKIVIEEEVEIKGNVFMHSSKVDRKLQSIVSIAEKSKITGQVYASELLELKGEVIGSVYCKKLLLKTRSSVYENHLMDATINRTELSEHFVGVSLTEEIKQQSIIKWLN